MAAEFGEEREWIARSRDGDVWAFNQLVEAYQDRVYNLCLRMMASPQAAEDAAQDAFIAAFRSIGGLRSEHFRTWMFRIASNTCLDALRKRKRSREADLPDSREEPDNAPEFADPASGPEESVLQLEMREEIEAALMAIPADQRLAIVLSDIEGMDYAEIAVSIGCSIGTVKSRISRGRGRLRELLAGRLREGQQVPGDKG